MTDKSCCFRECSQPRSFQPRARDRARDAHQAGARLCKKLGEIAGRVIVSHGRVHGGIELGVVPVVQTFNGKLDFNPHVHALVTARDLQASNSRKTSSLSATARPHASEESPPTDLGVLKICRTIGLDLSRCCFKNRRTHHFVTSSNWRSRCCSSQPSC